MKKRSFIFTVLMSFSVPLFAMDSQSHSSADDPLGSLPCVAREGDLAQGGAQRGGKFIAAYKMFVHFQNRLFALQNKNVSSAQLERLQDELHCLERFMGVDDIAAPGARYGDSKAVTLEYARGIHNVLLVLEGQAGIHGKKLPRKRLRACQLVYRGEAPLIFSGEDLARVADNLSRLSGGHEPTDVEFERAVQKLHDMRQQVNNQLALKQSRGRRNRRIFIGGSMGMIGVAAYCGVHSHVKRRHKRGEKTIFETWYARGKVALKQWWQRAIPMVSVKPRAVV